MGQESCTDIINKPVNEVKKSELNRRKVCFSVSPSLMKFKGHFLYRSQGYRLLLSVAWSSRHVAFKVATDKGETEEAFILAPSVCK